MSYEIVPFNPANLPSRRGEQSELMKAITGGGKGTTKRISIRGKVFRCMVGGEEIALNTEGHLDVIIVNSTPLKDVNRIYYGSSYDAKADAAPPKCFSDNGRVPNKEVAEPMAASCNECPMNVNGSNPGGKGKACKYQKRIAVVLAADPDSGVYQLILPSQSIFPEGKGQEMPYNAYVRYLASLNCSIDEIVTRLSFDNNESTPKLFMRAIGHPSAELQDLARFHGESDEAKKAVVMSVYQGDAKPRLEAPKVEEAPKAQEAPAPEPVVRPAKKAEKPDIKKPDINAVLSKFASKPAAPAPAVSDDEDDEYIY